MVAQTLPMRMTADQRDTLPDDGNRYEVIGGYLFMAAAPTWNHQVSARAFFRDLDRASVAEGGGEVVFAPLEIRFTLFDAVQPDLVYITSERLEEGWTSGRFEGAPDLVVEVLSPSTRNVDLGQKAELYARNGVREYWTVDVDDRLIQVYRLVNGEWVTIAPDAAGRIRSSVLPNLLIDPARIFADLR